MAALQLERREASADLASKGIVYEYRWVPPTGYSWKEQWFHTFAEGNDLLRDLWSTGFDIAGGGTAIGYPGNLNGVIYQSHAALKALNLPADDTAVCLT